ncbi:hypothetical protein SARC_07345 [Sphaeroforma arctica JP610]|uniref:Uncharacterized protein n=1 Tax=Sphaeroforma arctica JP610 TaxID=667725 RepID=A0A0L0FTZ7_9EUKA|nr:hypothetical protein SARC_07345 [Sphaeroforma arctica JP610]KNC80297.1 hypothetical protein SARC_07345 [Sphaeroforma arctica JP610]|eukprot:XP_014154199.1 hypothetical protein SARC_07345 [Sphaeroforma arctica JP610]
MEREAASAAAATATAEATAAAADAFNRPVAEAFVYSDNSPDNASDKDVATPIKETTSAERARGPTIASTSKLAFSKPRRETRDMSQDAPTNSSDETQKEKPPIIGDKDESQKIPAPEPEEEASSSGKPESMSETTEPTRISKFTTENADLKNQLAALKKGMTVEHVDRMYGSGKHSQHLCEHVSPGTTEALQKWTEHRQAITPEKRKDLSTKCMAVDPDVLSVSIPYEELPPEVQDLASPVLSPGHESPVLEGIVDPEAGRNTPPPLPDWGEPRRREPVKTGYVVHKAIPPELLRPTPIPGTEHRQASTIDFTRGNKNPRRRINDVEFNRFDRTAVHQPAEDFLSDEVAELNKAVDFYTKDIEIAHGEHREEDVSYYANITAIKQKRIDQLLQAQRGQDHRDNQKYKGQISRLKSNWDANSKQVKFINNHDLDTLTLIDPAETSLLSKDMRSPGLSSILTEPVENTPIQSYILKLDADLKRPDIAKDKAQKWYEFLAKHVFCKNIGNNDRESLYTELRRNCATEARDKGHETKFHLSRLKWEQFYDTVSTLYPAHRIFSKGKAVNSKPRELRDQRYLSRQTSDDKPHQTCPNQTRARDSAEPKDKEPPYKEIKKCADTQCGYDMYQLIPNGYWKERHAPNCTHFLARCDKCEKTDGYHATSCDTKPDIKLE